MDQIFEDSGGRQASQAYWNALRTLRSAWREIFGEDLPTVGNRAKDAFEQAIAQVKDRLARDAAGGARLRNLLAVDAEEDIAEVLLQEADMDDVAPNVVKQAILEECDALGAGRHELRDLLRPVLDRVFDAKTRRPRVGANRHWRRLLQYVREIEENLTWSTGKGIHLMNAGGGGRVLHDPVDPGTLVVMIDPDHF